MLFLVVGPSGAGKDTLLALSRAALGGDSTIRFARRVITRGADVGEEGHEAVGVAEFVARREQGGFALWWEAHGMLYGIPVDVTDDLRAGRRVVASVSRAVLRPAILGFPVRVLEITASPDILAQRLSSRARESAEDIARRLAREVPLDPGLDVTRILNDGLPEEGAAKLLAALRLAPPGRA